MNILLVYPRYPDTFWSFKHVLQLISKKATFPPLGLLTVAAMLPGAWNKKLVDTNVRELKDEDILWADLVFISAMIIQKDSAQEIIDRSKALGRKVVAGGPAFTAQRENFNGVDHFVLNEAEATLKPFIEDLQKGEAKPFYTSEDRPSITETPIPLWRLIDFKDYASMTVQYSRGCPFDCEFCDIIQMNGRIPRTKTVDQMLGELQFLYDAGWRGSLFIVDDNFIGNKIKVKQMLPSFIKWQKERKYPFQFFTEASINLADDSLLMQMMSDANFYKVFIGIETPSIDSLKECGKHLNASRNLTESVKIIHQHGMQVMGGFIVGFDNDTESIFDSQVKFIQQIGVVTAMVGMLNALPQTRLWKRLKDEQRLLKDSTGENTDGCLNFIPKIGTEKLVEGYKDIISKIYTPEMYYKRIYEFLKSYKPTVKAPVSLDNIRTFIRSAWKIGIMSRARLHYWKLITKTFFTKIEAFPIAVELAICGLHFERIARQMTPA
jgi:radical SAM superfamily enzyme YgiQ (UPF0313 family)